MAKGAKFVIDFEVTDTTIPILRKDPILSAGSLILLDLSNGSIAAPATIPAGTTVGIFPNVAWEEAKTIFGAGDITSLGFNSQNGLSDTNGKVELTAKKGIHAILSQVNHTSSAQRFIVALPDVYKNYIHNNPTHKYFVSTWRKKTRLYLAGLDFSFMGLDFQTTGAYQLFETVQGRGMTASGALGQRDALVANDLNVQIRNRLTGGATAGTPTSAGTSDAGTNLMAAGGGMNAYSSTGNLNKMPSVITYRVYIEDMTVSGRTYAEVDAIDKALYDAAFAVGGKFNGDVFTDPATVA